MGLGRVGALSASFRTGGIFFHFVFLFMLRHRDGSVGGLVGAVLAGKYVLFRFLILASSVVDERVLLTTMSCCFMGRVSRVKKTV